MYVSVPPPKYPKQVIIIITLQNLVFLNFVILSFK